MTRYFAFLRAINVGGHTVKMDLLRNIFEDLGLNNVETFIASGNVIFETSTSDIHELEQLIQNKLKAVLGFDTATFLRTRAELVSIADYQPFSPADLVTAAAFNVAFLHKPLDQETSRRLTALTTEIDILQDHNSEIYWLCQKKQSESTISNAVLEKTTGKPSTLRGIATLKKLLEKYPQD